MKFSVDDLHNMRNYNKTITGAGNESSNLEKTDNETTDNQNKNLKNSKENHTENSNSQKDAIDSYPKFSPDSIKETKSLNNITNISSNKTKSSEPKASKIDNYFNEVDNTTSSPDTRNKITKIAKSKPNTVTGMFKDIDNPKKDDVSLKDFTKTTIKAATLGNPKDIVKVAKMATKLKRKKSKFKKILIISSILLPLVFLSIIGATIIVIFTVPELSSQLLTPREVISNRYTEASMVAERGRNIMQKTYAPEPAEGAIPEEKPGSNLYGSVTTSDVPYFSQHDARWKNNTYSPGETYSQSACGATSLAMLLTYLEYDGLDSDKDGVTLPTDTGQYSLDNGHVSEEGTSSSLFYDLSGLQSEYLNPQGDLPRIKELLGEGKPLIYSVNGSQTFAYSHIMVATGYKDGKWTVNDPNNYEFSNQEWDETAFLSGALYFVYIHK